MTLRNIEDLTPQLREAALCVLDQSKTTYQNILVVIINWEDGEFGEMKRNAENVEGILSTIMDMM